LEAFLISALNSLPDFGAKSKAAAPATTAPKATPRAAPLANFALLFSSS